MAVVLLMALPLQWRYALEGRPYSQAMFFAILGTILALRLARRPGPVQTALYGLALAAGMYTLPLLVLFPLAHFVWVSLCLGKPQRLRVQIQVAIAGAAAVLLLAPWVIWANTRWAGAIAGNQGHFLLHPRLFLVLLHELPGGGYVASLLLLAAAGAGLASRGIARSTKVLLALLVAVPLMGTLVIDAIFDYFFAVRQLVQDVDELGDDAVAAQGRHEPAVHVDRRLGLLERAGQRDPDVGVLRFPGPFTMQPITATFSVSTPGCLPFQTGICSRR